MKLPRSITKTISTETSRCRSFIFFPLLTSCFSLCTVEQLLTSVFQYDPNNSACHRVLIGKNKCRLSPFNYYKRFFVTFSTVQFSITSHLMAWIFFYKPRVCDPMFTSLPNKFRTYYIFPVVTWISQGIFLSLQSIKRTITFPCFWHVVFQIEYPNIITKISLTGLVVINNIFFLWHDLTLYMMFTNQWTRWKILRSI